MEDREYLDYPQVTKIVIEFADGAKTEYGEDETAWVVVAQTQDGNNGWIVQGTDDVSEDVILDYSYDMIDSIEGERVKNDAYEMAVEAQKLKKAAKDKTHLKLVK